MNAVHSKVKQLIQDSVAFKPFCLDFCLNRALTGASPVKRVVSLLVSFSVRRAALDCKQATATCQTCTARRT